MLISSDTINVLNVKVFIMVLIVELYLFKPLSVTVSIFERSQQCQFSLILFSCLCSDFV